MSRNVGGYLVELLAANDIDTVFGIPGVHNLELYRGLTSTSIRHVLVRHKQGGVLHELYDQAALAAGVFGVARVAFGAEDVRDHLRLCLASFRTGRPRPAYLEIPLDVLAETT